MHCGVDLHMVFSHGGTPVWLEVRGGLRCGVAFHEDQQHEPDLTDRFGVEAWLAQ